MLCWLLLQYSTSQDDNGFDVWHGKYHWIPNTLNVNGHYASINELGELPVSLDLANLAVMPNGYQSAQSCRKRSSVMKNRIGKYEMVNTRTTSVLGRERRAALSNMHVPKRTQGDMRLSSGPTVPNDLVNAEIVSGVSHEIASWSTIIQRSPPLAFTVLHSNSKSYTRKLLFLSFYYYV
jgi:hypothetical protein